MHHGGFNDDVTWLSDIAPGDGKSVAESIFPPDAPYNIPVYPIPKPGTVADEWNVGSRPMAPIEPRYDGDDLAGAYGAGNRDESEEPTDPVKERCVSTASSCCHYGFVTTFMMQCSRRGMTLGCRTV